jgi:hypothetical protein
VRRSSFLALSLIGLAAPLGAQVEARPILEGTAFLGDSVMNDGVVVLHHLSDGTQGELDSIRVDEEGRFRFELPQAPDPARSDVFFASLQHDGVLYFGPAITRVLELDSVYEIRAYDTLLAPAQGVDMTLESRSVFIEPDSSGLWRFTDLFQLHNDRGRTVVARDGGLTWSYPLPEGARDVVAGQGDMTLAEAEYVGGEVGLSSALAPGQRLFVVRYRMDSPYVTLPTPGGTAALEVFVREPGPAVEIDGLTLSESIDLEEGGTFRRYGAVDYVAPSVVVAEGSEVRRPPKPWIAAGLALLLTAAGLLALRGGLGRVAEPPVATSAGAGGPDRQAILVEIARLDEAFEAKEQPGPRERSAYERRRSELLTRLRARR